MSNVHMAPRISVNKLGEYLTAGPTRRRSIIYNQKYPRNYIVRRYHKARTGIANYLKSGAENLEVIEGVVSHLSTLTPQTDFEAQDTNLSLQALDAFKGMADQFNLSGLHLCRETGPRRMLNIAGVAVSIRPDILVRGYTPRGKSFVGAIKVHISKGYALNPTAGEYVSTLLRRYLEESPWSEYTMVQPQFCMVIDVFAGEVYRAPKHFIRRLGHISAACEEIQMRWQHT